MTNRNHVTQTIISGLLMGLLVLASGKTAMASTYEPTVPTKAISIDKMVGVPQKDSSDVNYVDNLGSSDYTFTADQVVYFRLRVKNTSDAKLTDVVVKDFEPSYTALMADPGSVSNETLTINAGDFEPGEEKSYIIRTRVDNSIPDGTTCVTNRARAEDDGVSAEDSSQFCIRKPGTTSTGTTTVIQVPQSVPSTGAADGLLIVLGALGTAAAGIKLHRKV